MKSFVTGATGFIGSAIVRRLIDRGHEVRVLARRGSDRRNIDGLDIEVVEGDLRDPDILASCLHGVDNVFHAAADYRLWVPDPKAMYEINVEGTLRLVNACLAARTKRLVYTSSVAALGLEPNARPATEATRGRLDDMIGHYKRSKFLADELVRDAIATSGLPAVVVYPTAPVGPRDIKPTPTGQTIADAASGRMPAYVDTGLNIVHVDDVAEGHLLALEIAPVGERFILGGENLTLAQILGVVGEITGRPAPRIRLPHRLLMPVAAGAEAVARVTGGSTRITRDALRMAAKKMYFSSARAHTQLGYSPRPAREAIADAVEWFAACGRNQ